MQQLDDTTLLGPRDLKVITVEGTFTGPMYLKVEDGKVTCRRDIDVSWTDVPARAFITLEEVLHATSSWLKFGPPLDMDGRVIALSLT